MTLRHCDAAPAAGAAAGRTAHRRRRAAPGARTALARPRRTGRSHADGPASRVAPVVDDRDLAVQRGGAPRAAGRRRPGAGGSSSSRSWSYGLGLAAARTSPRSSSRCWSPSCSPRCCCPVTKRLHAWGVQPRRSPTGITVLGGLLVIARRALPDRHPDRRRRRSTLGTNVVTGFNPWSNWLQNGPLQRQRRPTSTPTSGSRGSRTSWSTARTRSPRTRPRSAPRSATSWPASRSRCSRCSTSCTTGRRSSSSC